MRKFFKNSELGTLLLDSLTAIAILAIVFAVSFPNYQRARQQAAVGIDGQQLDAIVTAVVLYGNDNKGSYAALEGLPSGEVTNTNPGAQYLSTTPVSPIDGVSNYNLIVPGIGTSLFVITDSAAVTDPTLLGNYKDLAGTACSATELYLAEDTQHGIYCSSNPNTGA